MGASALTASKVFLRALSKHSLKPHLHRAGSYSVPVVTAYALPAGFDGPGAGFLPEYY